MGLSVILLRYNRVKWYIDQPQFHYMEEHIGKKWTDVLTYSFGIILIIMGILATIYQL
jgi:hypothetical protein